MPQKRFEVGIESVKCFCKLEIQPFGSVERAGLPQFFKLFGRLGDSPSSKNPASAFKRVHSPLQSGMVALGDGLSDSSHLFG